MIYMLIGNIASGKSTWTQKYDKSHLVINDDAIVLALHGGVYQKYDKTLKPLYKTIENIIIGFTATKNIDVIIDRPNLTINTRKRYIGLAHSFDMDICGVVFEFHDPVVHTNRRTWADNRGYDYSLWLKVATENNKIYEPPSINEGFKDIIYVH